MKRTISVMVGKGSVNHNSRKFHAKNTDPERSHLNVEYCNEDIRDVYHELFEEARIRYNAKQRKDRHLHIDFIPFITESKRAMDTRVSLKQALARLGFKGGTRSKTEWNQWVASEKEHLAAVMERYGIEWEQKGTHEKHLSVLDFQKQERAKEVANLEERKAELLEENSAFETINGALCNQLTQVNEELHSSEEELSQSRQEADKAKKRADKSMNLLLR